MTLNAAASLGLGGGGRLARSPASAPTSSLLDAPDDRHLIYHWGVNLVATVVRDGRVAWSSRP